jgi:hypothetical protein
MPVWHLIAKLFVILMGWAHRSKLAQHGNPEMLHWESETNRQVQNLLGCQRSSTP